MAKQFYLFHQTRGHFSQKYDICPHVQLQTVVLLFYGGFGAVASSLLSGLSGYVDIGLVFTVDIDTFVPVSSSIFTRSFAVVLGLICTFRTKVYSSVESIVCKYEHLGTMQLSYLSGRILLLSPRVKRTLLRKVQINLRTTAKDLVKMLEETGTKGSTVPCESIRPP